MKTSRAASERSTKMGGTGSAANYAYPWLPDQEDGTYCNPVLYADYSDPDAIRIGDDFFLTASSFNCTPGLPILHSRDLVNWTIVGHALKNLPHPRYDQVQPGCGVWAPSIRYHHGRYWIFFATPDEGIYVVTANHPAGKWSEPHLVEGGLGLIDPCPLWDDDGQAYLVHAYAYSRSGLRHLLRVRPMAPDGLKLLGEGEIVFCDPARHPTLEGPKFLKKDGRYYLLAPAGGVETGWQVALRSNNIFGPYEDKIVLSQGRTAINGPHQGALVDTPENGWWFVHFQDAGLYGRIVHLQPVQWQDGWPQVGQEGEPALHHAKPLIIPAQHTCAPQTSDEFDQGALGLQWQWHANHSPDWHSLASRPGWLRLFPQPATPSLNEQPNLLLQKLPARSFSVETALELIPLQSGEESGLVVMGESYASLGIQHDGRKNRIVFRTHEKQSHLFEIASNTVKLRMEMQSGGKCSFGFSADGGYAAIPANFQARKGQWSGAKVGLYSLRRVIHAPAGYVDVDYFRFTGSQRRAAYQPTCPVMEGKHEH